MNKKIVLIIGIVALVLIMLAIVNKSKTPVQVPETILWQPNNTTSTSTKSGVSASIVVQPISVSIIEISGLESTPISPTSSLISWMTDLPATTEIYYSVTPPAQNKTRMVIKDPKLTLSHAVEITHLSPATEYYFTVVANNPQKKATSTMSDKFTTLAR